jgi:F-type H+-transporting ATPase subunit delta
VSSRLVARRYAKALLDTGIVQGTLPTLQKELGDLDRLVRSNPDLARLLSAPLIAPSRKAATLDAILLQAGASQTTRRFLRAVAEGARLACFHDIVAAFDALVDVHMGVMEAGVSTAHPLSEAQTRALTEGLSTRTGATVRLRWRQDAALLGGIKVQLGSTIFDASLQGQLRQLKARLLNA